MVPAPNTRPWLSSGGVWHALGFLLLALVLPWATVLILLDRRSQGEMQRHAEDEARMLSAVAAARVEDQIKSADALLRAIAQLVADHPNDTASNDRLIQSIARDLPLFIQAISAFDTTGRLLGTSMVRTPQVAQLNLGDRAYFRQAMRQDSLVISPPMVGRASGIWSIALARRIVRNGRVLGVVAATPRLREIGASLMTAGSPQGALTGIVDTSGIIVARSLDPDRWVGVSVRDSAGILNTITTRNGSAYSRSLDGTMRYGGWTSVRRAPWIVFVGITTPSDQLALLRERRVALWLTLLSFAVALALALRLARRIGGPLQLLAQDAERLGVGDLTTRTIVHGVAEVRALGESFNTMAIALEQQDRELRQSHQYLATLVAASPVAIVTVDIEGHIASWNPAAECLFGWRASEILGMPLPIPLEPPDAGAANRQQIITRRSGEQVTIAVARAPLSGVDGLPVGVLYVAEDVTARQRAEEELRHAQRLDAVGKLAGGVAHDFNNLLTVITSSAELIMEELPGDHPVRPDVQLIQDTAQQGATLTRQLLTFSRRTSPQVALFDAREVIREAERMLRRLLPAQITLTVETDDAPLPVKMDAGHLEQLLVNLVVNSRDALPNGGTIRIAAHAPADAVELTVSDNGAGMDEATQASIFEPFFTTKHAGQGTGLGLSTVRDIVAQAGGRVAVESVLGAGTTLRLTIPLSRLELPPRPVSVPAHQARPAGTTGRSVLLVEDEFAIRQMTSRLLRRDGYSVLETDNGEEALALRRAHPECDIIVTDLMMPRMTGLALVEELRDNGDRIPVVLLSGFVDPDTHRRAAALHAVVVLSKPYAWHDLQRAMHASLH